MIKSDSQKDYWQALWRICIIVLAQFALTFHGLVAQEKINDQWQSIVVEMDTARLDSILVERYIDAGYFRRQHYQDSVNFYANKAIELSEHLGYIKGKISALVLKGSFAGSQNRFEEAIRFYKLAIADNQSQNSISREAQIKDNLANIYMRLGRYDTALQIKFEALSTFLALQDTISLAISYGGIGSLFLTKKDFRQAVEYSLQGLRFDRSPQRALTMGNIGAAKRALGELDSAIYYYRLAAATLPDYPNFQGKNFNNISLLFLEQEHFDSANWYSEQAITKFKSLNDTLEMARVLMNQSAIDLAEKRISRGLRKCHEIKTLISSRGTLKDRQRLNEIFTKLYLQQGDFKNAWIYNTNQQHLQDSLNNLDLQTRVEEIQIKYAASEKEKQILTQKLEIEEKNRQANQLRGGLLVSILLGFSIIYLLVQRARITKFKTQKDQSEKEIEILALQHQNKLESMNAMIQGQELERTRIAKDLHDGLGGLLSTVKIHFLTVQQEIESINKLITFKKASHMLDDACDEVRRIAHNMMPDALDQLGLSAVILDLSQALEQKGYIVNTQLLNVEDRLPEELEINLYRIIQELINNIIKYAEASKIMIQLYRDEHKISLTVEDDGNGFDLNANHQGIGLQNIKSRVDFLSGEFDISSRPGEGTSVFISLVL